MAQNIRVVFFQRKPYPFHKSLEYIFEDVRSRMPAYITCVTKVVSEFSKGIIPRIKIAREAQASQGDVNHITGDIHFASLLLDRKKTMLTVLDLGVLNDSAGIRHALLKFFWFTLPLKKCAVVTVISDATRRELLRYTSYPNEKIITIPVAISPLYTYHPQEFRKSKPRILLVGTTPNKNLLRVIEAVKDIPCELHIIGRLNEEMLSGLSQHNISYTNAFDLSQQQIVQAYVDCDILSFVSTYEGFGMPIVEANAVGRPVITSNVLSMPEVAGEAAALVDPLNIGEIKEGLLRIIHDDEYRNDLIQKGLENCKKYDPQSIANQYLRVYEDLHAGRYQ